ncbi:MAG: general secretion pathway protein GspK [Planctomycetes bacterium]|nr:general secretion pathway protein GspK [Planctomycetota bacterium]
MPDSPTIGGKARARKRGFALLIVMILIILLAVIITAFVQDVWREVSVSQNVRDDVRADYLAQMGLVRGQVILRLDDNADFDSLNEPWAQPVPWDGETWGAEGSDSAGESPSVTPPEILITDEERKFNLLTLVRGNATQKEKAKEVLTRLIQICRREDERLELDGESRSVRRIGEDAAANTDTLLRNLVKYLEERESEDSDELEFNADPTAKPDVRGMKKQTPYEMLTVGELLQVEGWTNELLYGPLRKADEGLSSRGGDDSDDEQYTDWRDLSDQEKFEQRRTSIENVDEQSMSPDPLPLISFITLYSTGFININTCSREVLLALDKDLTWDVVEQIMTAREADRQDVAAAEENGGVLPEEEEPLPVEGEQPAEDEDKASFRPQDLASFQAFVSRVNNQTAEEGEPPPAIEGLTEEIYNRFRPWLVTRSTVFVVESSATVGKVTHSIRAVFRRTQAQAAPQPAQPAEGETPAQPEVPPEDALPTEPSMNLTLLFRDIVIGG